MSMMVVHTTTTNSTIKTAYILISYRRLIIVVVLTSAHTNFKNNHRWIYIVRSTLKNNVESKYVVVVDNNGIVDR